MRIRFTENHKRSVLKAITFRCVILLSDAIIVFTITHRYDLTIGVMLGTNIASTFLYYLHERMWNSIHYGKIHQKGH